MILKSSYKFPCTDQGLLNETNETDADEDADADEEHLDVTVNTECYRGAELDRGHFVRNILNKLQILSTDAEYKFDTDGPTNFSDEFASFDRSLGFHNPIHFGIVKLFARVLND